MSTSVHFSVSFFVLLSYYDTLYIYMLCGHMYFCNRNRYTHTYILYMVQRTAELYTYLCLPHSICIVLTHRRRDRDTFFLRRGPLVFILNLDARLASSSSALSRSFAIWIIRSDLSIATSFKSLSSIGSHF